VGLYTGRLIFSGGLYLEVYGNVLDVTLSVASRTLYSPQIHKHQNIHKNIIYTVTSRRRFLTRNVEVLLIFFRELYPTQKLWEPLSILIKYKTTVTPKMNILVF
jgi:hypothetical protein